MFVCDHSTNNNPTIIGGSLKREGFSGVIRYAAEGRENVNITSGEVHDLRDNGIEIGIVLEHEDNWLLIPNLVEERVLASREICRACGLPDGTIYMASDFDVTLGGPTRPGSPGDRNMQVVFESLQKAGNVIGRQNVGFYGSKFAIDWLVVKAPWITKYWQTEAWSMNEKNDHACLFQRAQTVTVAGVEVDVDEIWKSNWGQRDFFKTPEPRPRPPEPDEYDPAFKESYDSLWELGHKYTTARGKDGLKAGAQAMMEKL